jgi:hypothetical protein
MLPTGSNAPTLQSCVCVYWPCVMQIATNPTSIFGNATDSQQGSGTSFAAKYGVTVNNIAVGPITTTAAPPTSTQSTPAPATDGGNSGGKLPIAIIAGAAAGGVAVAVGAIAFVKFRSQRRIHAGS